MITDKELKLNEERDLLIKEVCARIPYDVKCKFEDKVYDILGFAHGRVMLCLPFMSNTITTPIENIELYLMPLSSMTEEQFEEILDIVTPVQNGKAVIEEEKIGRYLEFCYTNNIDFNGLIDKGIVKDATNLNIY